MKNFLSLFLRALPACPSAERAMLARIIAKISVSMAVSFPGSHLGSKCCAIQLSYLFTALLQNNNDKSKYLYIQVQTLTQLNLSIIFEEGAVIFPNLKMRKLRQRPMR